MHSNHRVAPTWAHQNQPAGQQTASTALSRFPHWVRRGRNSLALLGLAFTGFTWAAQPAIQTQFGTLRVSPSFQLQLDGTTLNNPFTDELFSPHHNKPYVVGNRIAVLLSGNTRPNCLQYQWLVMSQNTNRWTPVFGTCDTKIKVTVSGDELIASMNTQLEGSRRRPVTFVLKQTGFAQREVIPEWPQGFIDWAE